MSQDVFQKEKSATDAALAKGCEVCGAPATWAISRRAHNPQHAGNSMQYIGCITTFDETAPIHARCSTHSGADAYLLDGVPPVCGHHGPKYASK